jgi:hypothetical protein
MGETLIKCRSGYSHVRGASSYAGRVHFHPVKALYRGSTDVATHTRILRRVVSLGVIAILTLYAPGHIEAARFPRSPAELLAEADLVVVAEVIEIEIQSEHSRVEGGFGNYDWGVYHRLRVREVEKGESAEAGEEIVARCFVVQMRKSTWEYIGPQSHGPIPETGQIVRAYLRKTDNTYAVLHPNGYESPTGTPVVQSAAVKRLRKGGYTYLLPLELWIIIGLFAALVTSVVCLIINVRRYLARRRAAREAGEPRKHQFSLVWLLTMTFFVAGGFALGAQRFALYVVLAAFLTLVWFTIRPPRTMLARHVWWGVNLAFASSVVAPVVYWFFARRLQ